MSYDPARHHRRSTRYPGFDYASASAYFITICAQDRDYGLSTVLDTSVSHLQSGEAVLQAWNGLLDRFSGLQLDAFVMMPNHVHGIILLGYTPTGGPHAPRVGARFIAPNPPSSGFVDGDVGAMNRAPTLGEVVRAFKAVSTRLIRTSVDASFAWQRNYHDRIIRSDRELDRIRAYIDANPANWGRDPDHPDNGADPVGPSASLRHPPTGR